MLDRPAITGGSDDGKPLSVTKAVHDAQDHRTLGATGGKAAGKKYTGSL